MAIEESNSGLADEKSNTRLEEVRNKGVKIEMYSSRKRFLFFIFLLLLSSSSLITLTSYSQPYNSVHYFITINNDGSAVWKVCWYNLLATNDDLVSFQDYIRNYIPKNREVLLKNFIENFNSIIVRASMVTKRRMSLSNFNLSAYVLSLGNENIGVLEYSFLWSGFSKVEGKTITIGDVFEGGFYLYDGDSLTILFPPYFQVKSYSPQPSSMNLTSITWNGPMSFNNEEPYLVLTVKEASLRISLDKSSANVNEKVKVYCSIDPSFSGLKANITYISPSGRSITNIITIPPSGSFEDTFSPSEEGNWKIVAEVKVMPSYSVSASTSLNVVPRPFYEQPIFIIAVAVLIVVVAALIVKLLL